MLVYRYICVYRVEMVDYLRILFNLFDYFFGFGDDVRFCVIYYFRYFYVVLSGFV